MKRGSKFLIVALSSLAMAGTAAAQGDDGTGDGTGDATGDGTDAGTGDGTDAGTGDAGTGDAGTGDAGTGDAGTGDMGGDMGGDMAAEGGGGHLVTPKGKISIFAALQVNLSKDLGVAKVGDPISIQPDIFYGVMPKLEVGVAHSSYNLTGFWGGFSFPSGGVCIGDEMGPCADKVYNGPIGILGRYALVDDGKLGIAADAGLVLRALDPFAIGAKAGIRGHYMAGKLMIGFAPNIQIGITKRDEGGGKEFLAVPVDVHYMVSPKLGVGVQTGIQGPLDEFGDSYAIPVSLGAMFMPNEKLGVGGAFNLNRIAGFDGPGAADLRSLTVFVMWHN
jgi:hypothetical protein